MLTAVQQFQLGTVLNNEKQARGTLHLMKQAGYDGIELCGFMVHPASAAVKLMTRLAGMPVGKGGKLPWQALVSEAGLQVVALHMDLGSIERDCDAVIDEAKAFGTSYVVITGMYRFDYGSAKALADLSKRLNMAGERLKTGGISLLYHNHNCEYLKIAPDMTGYRYLIENTDPAYVNFEFDSYWTAEAGVNPLDMMDLLGSRMKLYHINDRGTRHKGGACMTPILKSDSVELGQGNMDLPALIRKAKAAPVDAIILESHRNWIAKSPIRNFQIGADYLSHHL